MKRNHSPQNRSVEVVQITDTHLFGNTQKKLLNVDVKTALLGVVQHIKKHCKDSDLLLVSGDIAQEEPELAYDALPAMLRGCAPLVRVLPGNHDDVSLMGSILADHCQPVTDLGAWRVLSLNTVIPGSNAGTLAQDQLQRLEQECGSAPEKHFLVAMHHNPVPMGSAWLDQMMVDNAHELFAIAARQQNIRAFVWGHVHQEYDSYCSFGLNREPVRLLACPATSIQFKPQSFSFALDPIDPGYRRIRLHPNGMIESEVIRVPGLNIQPDIESTGY